ncbi:MAG: hypothetical protein LOD85_10925 [Clostridia bacterium]
MSEHVTLVNPYVIYECPDCGVRVATNSPDLTPDCPGCGLLDEALEFVGLGEFISAESKAEIERLWRDRETLAAAVMAWEEYRNAALGSIAEVEAVAKLRDAHGRALALLDGEEGGGDDGS